MCPVLMTRATCRPPAVTTSSATAVTSSPPIVATSGPGALHALNGLYDAYMDRVPVVAVLGQTATTALGGNYYQEVDLHSVFKDVGGAYIQTIVDASEVEHMVDRACRTALAAKAPTVLIVPSDVQERDALVKPPDAHGYMHSSTVPSSGVSAGLRALPINAATAPAATVPMRYSVNCESTGIPL